MVDFRKRIGNKTSKKVIDPVKLYESLDRASDKGPLILKKLSKLYPDCPKKPKHVAKSNPFADHDIESAIEVVNKWLPCYIEVKSTKSSSWGTVMISEAQISLARRSSKKARHTFAIVEFEQGAMTYKLYNKTLSELEHDFILTPMKYRLSQR